MIARRYTLDGKLGALTVRGATLKADVAEAVLKARLDLSLTELPQLTLTIFDPDLKLLGSKLFLPGSPTTAGTPIDYRDLKLECRAVSVDERNTITVTARDLAACKLKRAVAPVVRRNMSRTEAVRLDATAAGIRFVGEPSPRVSSLARETGESAWDAHGRWAQELGFYRFLSNGTLYFGRVSWLIQLADAVPNGRLRLDWLGDKSSGDLVSRPTFRRSGDDNRADATLDGKLVGASGDKVTPGRIAWATGVPTFDGLYVVDKVTHELDEASPVAFSGMTARNLTPQPPAITSPTAAPRAPQSTPVSARAEGGTGTAAAFVSYALSQAGDRYVFGAEARLTDPDPDAFDCSELVEWALARAGVRFVDGSANQIARAQGIPLAQGFRTRGALLYRPGHIGISLGDGGTIEARNRRYGVNRGRASDIRWTRAGLVPGLRY